MVKKIKFSKDPKVKVVSIEEFYNKCNFLQSINKLNIFDESTSPEEVSTYYKLTSKFLIQINYGIKSINFGEDFVENLESIVVAYRDGKTEYSLLSNYISMLDVKNKKTRSFIKEKMNLLPPYMEDIPKERKTFESYLIDTGYKTEIEELRNKYLVLDVETNGIRKSNDDLLSISIYDPTTGICYNRFLPLELQPLILTAHINGINDKNLADVLHIDQVEMNQLLNYFNMKDRIILTYSGGQGTFDSSVVANYCKRQNLYGFEDLKYDNIKRYLPLTPFGCEGQLTKDNLCRILDIKGVRKKHSGINDCILEWKLFEKLLYDKVFFINENLYRYHSDYIIPVSYLIKYPRLAKYANIQIPYIESTVKELFHYQFNPQVVESISKFPTNITGIAIENGINSLMQAKKQDNCLFLAENKSHLEFVGSLDSRIKKIPIIQEDDGTIKAIKKADVEYVEMVNESTKIINEQIAPVIEYIKKNIFFGDVTTQELCISNDGKILALCDLSDGKSVVEIKTMNIFSTENKLKDNIAMQLYYQSNGRKKYILFIQFDSLYDKETGIYKVVGLDVYIYKIELSVFDATKVIREKKLGDFEKAVINLIKSNPKISKAQIARSLGKSMITINYVIDYLESIKFLKRVGKTKSEFCWVILRNPDKPAKYKIDEFGRVQYIDNL